ncbi:RNA-binding domain-containing protein [Rhizoclosmatium globosum]|uniref:RNA-binding domain-containing protein n=2 Tax=Rhizoclosmatium globosum TaxID=329046 RepID=A0A1Y2BGG5_9FUNG|nr:hypothetical protein HDU99_001958 [Rhizoclosmatium hyalinum]ORY33816.1 RNA-binding domain-containing protein [Rhizoclosmatium globosum]|eukprot:ORY33816.1 RNA-binding domain-containing protein [Rhizoclosmatium globosum]
MSQNDSRQSYTADAKFACKDFFPCIERKDPVTCVFFNGLPMQFTLGDVGAMLIQAGVPPNSIETVDYGGAIASYGSTQDAINSAAALDGLVAFGYCTESPPSIIYAAAVSEMDGHRYARNALKERIKALEEIGREEAAEIETLLRVVAFFSHNTPSNPLETNVATNEIPQPINIHVPQASLSSEVQEEQKQQDSSTPVESPLQAHTPTQEGSSSEEQVHQFVPSTVGWRVYAGNLPFAFEEQELSQLFSQYGSVLSASIAVNKQGFSLGHGCVIMSTEKESLKAIFKLNRTVVNGRQIKVHQDKYGTVDDEKTTIQNHKLSDEQVTQV